MATSSQRVRVGATSTISETGKTKATTLLTIEPALRNDIIKYVLDLKGPGSRTCLYLSDLRYPAPITCVCRQLAAECRKIFTKFTLYIDGILGPSESPDALRCRDAICNIYGKRINTLCIAVRLIQQVEWRRPEAILSSILEMPGVHSASCMFVPSITGGTVTSITSFTPRLLARKLRQQNHRAHPHTKYIATFALTHHAGIFGWLRFANVGVKNLVIWIEGDALWDQYSFKNSIEKHRALPIIGLMASIIALNLYGIREIVVAGGILANVIGDMWKRIPNRTPIVGVTPILDILVEYPFLDQGNKLKEMSVGENGDMVSEARVGNLFGLRSSMQWQAMIMRARHDKSYPEWKFAEKGGE